MQTEWNYSELAAYYDKRPNYATDAVSTLLDLAEAGAGVPVADIGAGTGKLTSLLASRGCAVTAVEPNDAMRARGIENTAGTSVVWTDGTAEHTGLASGAFRLATFGSSFNVTDRMRTLDEVARLLCPRGWFACMWNHRDLEDPTQAMIEGIIRDRISGYSYGTRREDQTPIIDGHGRWGAVRYLEGRIVHTVSREDYLDAWRSHATLTRQAGNALPELLSDIARAIGPVDALVVPYATRIWAAQLRD